MSMNRDTELLLQSGIAAVRSDDKREGARILAQVVRKEPQSEDAWFWLAAATNDPSEAAACLRRVLAINPNNTRASQALEKIEQGGAGAAPATPPTRTLNTGELIAPASLSQREAAAAATPPPPPFGVMASSPAAVSSNTPPPPPFGTPSWAQNNDVADPYSNASAMSASTPAPISNLPPPPAFTGGGGMRLGQLDPDAAAAQASAAPVVFAGPPPFDPGVDLRASLLTPAAAAPTPTPVVVTPKARKVKQPKVAAVVVERDRKRRGLPILPIALTVAVLFLAVAAFLFLNRSAPPSVITTAEVSLTATASAASGSGTTPAAVANDPVANLATVNAGSSPLSTAMAESAPLATAVVNSSNEVIVGLVGRGVPVVTALANPAIAPVIAGGGAPASTMVAALSIGSAASDIAGGEVPASTVLAAVANGGQGSANTQPAVAVGNNTPNNTQATAVVGINTPISNVPTPTAGTGGQAVNTPVVNNPPPTAGVVNTPVVNNPPPTIAGVLPNQVNTPVRAVPTPLPTVQPTLPVSNQNQPVPTRSGGGEPIGGTTSAANTSPLPPGLSTPIVPPTLRDNLPPPEVLKYVGNNTLYFSYGKAFENAIAEGVIKPYRAGRIKPGQTHINLDPNQVLFGGGSGGFVPFTSTVSAGSSLTTPVPVSGTVAAGTPVAGPSAAAPTAVVTTTSTTGGNANQDQLEVIVDTVFGPRVYYYQPGDGRYERNELIFAMGRIARVIKDQPVPQGAYELNLISLEYANDLTFIANAMDRFFATGDVALLEEMANYYDKSVRDRERWEKSVQGGYPYRIEL